MSHRTAWSFSVLGFAATLFLAGDLLAYDEGDVVESKSATQLKVESRVVYTTRRGERLVVTKEQDGWLWVKTDGGQEAWISEDDVSPPTGPYTFPKTSITIAEIPGLSRLIYRYSEEALGTSADFEHDDFRAGVYVFKLGETNLPDGHESKPVEAHLKQAIGDIRRNEEEGRYSDVTELASGIIPLGDHARARWTSFHLKRKHDDLRMYSEVYVTARQGHFVKLRISYPETDVAAHRHLVVAVLDAVDQALAASSRVK